jgi:hypothetical protein
MEKSSISLFSRMPVPGTVMPEPKGVLIVMVSATRLPAASLVERWVVPESSAGRPGPSTRIANSERPQVQGARRQRGGLMRARRASA